MPCKLQYWYFCAFAVVLLYIIYIFSGTVTPKCPLKHFLDTSARGGDGNYLVGSGPLGNYFKKQLPQATPKILINPDIAQKEKKELTIRQRVQNLTVEEKRKYVIEKLLLNKTYCGQQHWDEYFHSENETSGYEANVYEFPWMVSLVNDEYRCNGFLISNRYFITTQECFRRGYKAATKPKILVGVHNMKKKISCDLFPYPEDCAVGVRELHIKEGFTINSIVLVKFDKGVSFSYFIRPICLPLEDDERPKIGETVMMSGWGRLLEKRDYVSIKKRNRQKVISANDDKCKSEHISDIKNWICTLPLQNSTTACSGDDGSPAMYMYKDNWFAAGVTTTTTTTTTTESTYIVNNPVYSIAITPDIVNTVLEVIYDEFKSQLERRIA